MSIKFNRITKIENKFWNNCYNVYVTYENGNETIFGKSKLKSGANKMVTEYYNKMRKNPDCILYDCEIIKL